MSEPFEVKYSRTRACVVDVCFMLDISASMQPCFDEIKKIIKSFIGYLATPDANAGYMFKNWRASICGYRDFEEDPKHGREPMVMTPFTRDVNELYARLDAMQAEGGCERESSLLDALYKVATRGATPKGAEPEPEKWRAISSARRCVIVLTDVAYREPMVVEEAKGGTVQDICNLLEKEGIILSLIAPEMECHYALSMTSGSEYEEIQVDSSIDSLCARRNAWVDYMSNPDSLVRVLCNLHHAHHSDLYFLHDLWRDEEELISNAWGFVDICFLLDISASMQPYFDEIKKNIKSFIRRLESSDAIRHWEFTNWRASICGYRNFEEDPKHGREPMVMTPFTRDVNELCARLDSMQAEGGGDEEESLLDALYTVVTRGKTPQSDEPEPDKWRDAGSAARCIIVLTDAPFHKTMVVDEYKGGTVQDIIHLLNQNRIRLSLFAPEMECLYALSWVGECCYEAIEVDTSIDPMRARQKALADYTSNPDNFARTMQLLAQPVSRSASLDVEVL